MKGRWRLLAWASQPLLIAVVLWIALDGSHRDPHIPLSFSGDALFHLAQSKTTLVQGWWWTDPFLGAPFTHNALLAPQSANVNQAIVRIAGMFTHDLVTAVTAAWTLMVLLSGLTSAWCLRLLGLSRAGAWGLADRKQSSACNLRLDAHSYWPTDQAFSTLKPLATHG